MGAGPVAAVRRALDLAGLQLQDIDVFEISETYAVQVITGTEPKSPVLMDYSCRCRPVTGALRPSLQVQVCINELGLDVANVNPNGGSIALGNPMGAIGGRLTIALLRELKRRGSTYGAVTIGSATGISAAAVFEQEA